MSLVAVPRYPKNWYRAMLAVMAISFARVIIPFTTFTPHMSIHHVINVLMLVVSILIFRHMVYKGSGVIIGNLGLMCVILASIMKIFHLYGADWLVLIGFSLLSAYYVFRFFSGGTYNARTISFFLFTVPILIAVALRILHWGNDVYYALFLISEVSGCIFLYGEMKVTKH